MATHTNNVGDGHDRPASDKLREILQEAKTQCSQAKTPNDLLNLRSHFIGKKSVIGDLMKTLGTLPPEERPAFGKQINDVKVEIEALLQQAQDRIESTKYAEILQAAPFDYTMPGRTFTLGALHPLTVVQQQMEDIFISMGYQIAEGPDVDDDFHNFDALNTPPDHPARNLADTFFIAEGVLLRTQTSTVQVRVMEKYKPPIKIISLGRCYRNDKFDATHSPQFSQIEGLVVDEGVSFQDLQDTINIFVKKMFGEGTKSRFRPHFFPFTEPSAEADVSCFVCGGAGCPTCKGTGWIELGGAGMVDPNVFDILGIDSEKYTGFAFGCGIERIALRKFSIPDIRLLYENYINIDFLKSMQ